MGWKKKLRSRAGETLAETLAALLIATIGLTMLASMITSSARLITKSRSVLSDYYAENNKLEERSGDVTVTFEIVVAYPGTDIAQETARVSYYENQTVGASPVIAYKYQKQP